MIAGRQVWSAAPDDLILMKLQIVLDERAAVAALGGAGSASDPGSGQTRAGSSCL
jgi:hypothetical protein